MSQFSSTYGFYHETISPYYHQSNGQAECTVKTVEALLSKSADPYLALLSYRATPLPWCRLSPAQLLMGRTIRRCSTSPGSISTRVGLPARSMRTDRKETMMNVIDQDLPDLPNNSPVWVYIPPNSQVPGSFVSAAPHLRSYLVDVSIRSS